MSSNITRILLRLLREASPVLKSDARRDRVIGGRHCTKLLLAIALAAIAAASCGQPAPKVLVIAESKDYEASIFRQNCAICHGAEANGKTLDDGKIVPSLRSGEFKFKTEAEILKQISDGGNGMPPFRGQLTDRELHMMAAFVHDHLRKE